LSDSSKRPDREYVARNRGKMLREVEKGNCLAPIIPLEALSRAFSPVVGAEIG